MINIEVLYEDADLAVIAKPAGVVVNRADTIKEETIQDWWLSRLAKTGENSASKATWKKLLPADFQPTYGTPEEIFAERGGVVHRLDKDTSGVLILAKNPGALLHLLHQFRTRQVEKTYVCLVHGRVQVQEDTVSIPLGRAQQQRPKFAVDVEGR
jgi:23S rRNA pseudouridine1911/1915/1917 synthase